MPLRKLAKEMAATVAEMLGFTPENAALKNQPNGYAGLNASSRVLDSEKLGGQTLTQVRADSGVPAAKFLQSGTGATAGGGATPSQVTVTFPTAYKSGTIPHVIAGGSASSVYAGSVTATSFVVSSVNSSGSWVPSDFTWIAIGEKT